MPTERAVSKNGLTAAQFARHDERLSAMEADVKETRRVQDGHTKTLENHTQILESHTQTLEEHTQRLDRIDRTLDEHTKILAEHSHKLDEHSADLVIIKATLAEHTVRLNVLEDKVDRGFERMDAGFAELKKLIKGLSVGY